MAREKGVVKWFSDRKGFGFIEREEGEDVFVHFDEIAGDGYRSLVEGEEVEFDVVRDPKGLRAESVERIRGPNPSSVVQARGSVRTLSESRRQIAAEKRRLARILAGEIEPGSSADEKESDGADEGEESLEEPAEDDI